MAIGFNSLKTHPNNLNYSYRLPSHQGTHAEFKACLKGGKENYRGYEMVVIRVNNNGVMDNSKPCSGCRELLKKYNFDAVWFSNKEGKFEVLPITI